MISETDLDLLKTGLQDIRDKLNTFHIKPETLMKYITAMEFMAAVRIRRTKFDELVRFGKVNVIKKRRKIYVPIEEVDRYFEDSSIL